MAWLGREDRDRGLELLAEPARLRHVDAQIDRLRHVAIHLIVFVVGGGLAWSVGATPLIYLGVQGSTLSNATAAGVLVSFGGSFFDEALGAVREFKKAQEKLRGGAPK